MESNGKALRIHVSSETTTILEKFGTFELKSRGEIEMKVYAATNAQYVSITAVLLGERQAAHILVAG